MVIKMRGKFKTKNQQLTLLREKNVNTPDGSAKILLESNYNELIQKIDHLQNSRFPVSLQNRDDRKYPMW